MPIPAAFNRATRTVRHQTARMTRTQKLSAATIAVVGASVLAGAVVPGAAQAAAPAPHAAVATTHAQPHTTAPTHHSTTSGHSADKSIAIKTTADAMPAHNNLDGWITQALSIMHKHHIPGSFEGIKRNALRESSGNPHAINNWDVNAQKGIPSKGLLQVIPPTFATYHVAGTSKNIYNPVSNIVAACNYAAHRYGSMDNVNSAY